METEAYLEIMNEWGQKICLTILIEVSKEWADGRYNSELETEFRIKSLKACRVCHYKGPEDYELTPFDVMDWKVEINKACQEAIKEAA